MKEEVPAKRGTGTLQIILLGVAVCGLGGGNWYLYSFLKDYEQNRLPELKRKYLEIVRMRKEIASIRAKLPPGATIERPAHPGDLYRFFEEKSTLCRMPRSPAISFTLGSKTGPWQEYSYSLNFGKAVKLNKLKKFLLYLERDRPYLKTKDLVLQFLPNQLVKVSELRISYFNRE